MGGIIEMLTASPELYKGKFFTACSEIGTTGQSGPATCSTQPPSGLKSILTLYNGASRTSGTGKNTIIIPLYVKVRVTAVGAAGTDSKFVVGIDTTDRSGAATSLAATLSPKQTRAGTDSSGAVTPTTSKATVYAGNITMSAATTTWRHMGTAYFRSATASFVAGDQITIVFNDTMSINQMVPTTLVRPAHFSSNLPIVWLEPGTCMTVQQVSVGQSGASFFDFQVAWCEIKNDSVA